MQPELDRLEKAALELGEHFETVQIFVSQHDSNSKGTMNCNWGVGNWFARYGQVKTWCLREENVEPKDVPGL